MSQVPPSVPSPAPAAPPPAPRKQGLSTGAIIAIVVGVMALVCIPIIALLIAILLPALGHARQAAQKAVCAANLHQVHVSLMVYASDNDEQFPPSLGVLVAQRYLDDPEVLLCPAADHEAGNPMHRSPKELAQWADAHSDYIYLRPSDGANVGGDVIVLYEPPGHHRDGVNMAFGDGRVEFLDTARALQLLQQQGAAPVQWNGGSDR